MLWSANIQTVWTLGTLMTNTFHSTSKWCGISTVNADPPASIKPSRVPSRAPHTDIPLSLWRFVYMQLPRCKLSVKFATNNCADCHAGVKHGDGDIGWWSWIFLQHTRLTDALLTHVLLSQQHPALWFKQLSCLPCLQMLNPWHVESA